jgi:hypothetical protein
LSAILVTGAIAPFSALPLLSLISLGILVIMVAGVSRRLFSFD